MTGFCYCFSIDHIKVSLGPHIILLNDNVAAIELQIGPSLSNNYECNTLTATMFTSLWFLKVGNLHSLKNLFLLSHTGELNQQKKLKVAAIPSSVCLLLANHETLHNLNITLGFNPPYEPITARLYFQVFIQKIRPIYLSQCLSCTISG